MPSMTAFDMHLWYECEKIKSNCQVCGQRQIERWDFIKNHDCSRFDPDGLLGRGTDRKKDIVKRV